MAQLDWKVLAGQVDNIVNDAFGLDVTITPWVAPITDGQPDPYKAGGAPDENRVVRPIRGCYVAPDAARNLFPRMLASDVVADMYLSVKSSDIGDARQGDRISIAELPPPWPNPFLTELNYVTPGDTGRSLMHLLTVKS